MRKLILGLFSFIALLALSTSCSSDPNSYENLLADENDAIDQYISRNNINVISSLPANNVWGANDYYKTSTGVYIHIVDTGSAGNTVYDGELIIARYYKITLTNPSDTIERHWTNTESAYPIEFSYNNSTGVPAAFHEAIKYMKRNNSVAKLIVPSKQGLADDATSVKPYAYDFKIILGE